MVSALYLRRNRRIAFTHSAHAPCTQLLGRALSVVKEATGRPVTADVMAYDVAGECRIAELELIKV